MPLTLHIFNPESDMALASGSPYYMPPARIAAMRAREALFPATYAKPGDAVLLMDRADAKNSEYYDQACRKGLEILMPGSMADWSRYTASPWGWNPQIAKFLELNCPGVRGVPSAEALDRLRRLSHRRTAARALSVLDTSLRTGVEIPVEMSDADEAVRYYITHKNLFIKAPWSSSGRGVLRTDDLELRHVEPWIRGIVRSQGSVMLEPVYDRKLDFATEWEIHHGVASFLGFSVFETSRRGKYHGNVTGSQTMLMQMIMDRAPKFDMRYVYAQKRMLEALIGPDYVGPAGIDMMVFGEGRIHPCVEINLRKTMGLICIV